MKVRYLLVFVLILVASCKASAIEQTETAVTVKTATVTLTLAPTKTLNKTPTTSPTVTPTITSTYTPTASPVPTQRLPDTSMILYVAGYEDGNPTCLIKAVSIDGSDDFSITTSPPAFNCWRPRFSPDGKKIVFANHEDGYMYVMNLDGSGLVKVVDSIVEMTWSPDGTQLAYYVRAPETQQGQLVVVNADGSDPQVIGYQDVGICDGCLFVFEISWSPDGQWIYTPSDDGGMVTANIFKVDGMEHRELGDPLFPMDSVTSWLYYKEWPILSAAAWSPDSQRLALPTDPKGTGCANLSILSLQEDRNTLALEDFSLPGEADKKVKCFWDNFYWSQDGQSILGYGYHPSNLVDSVIFVVSPETNSIFSLGQWDGHPGMSVWSSDSSQLAFVSPASEDAFSSDTPLVIMNNVPNDNQYQILADSVKDYPGSLYWLQPSSP
jgi:Tol biopolymer transport system component